METHYFSVWRALRSFLLVAGGILVRNDDGDIVGSIAKE